jgi:hypothetical protein
MKDQIARRGREKTTRMTRPGKVRDTGVTRPSSTRCAQCRSGRSLSRQRVECAGPSLALRRRDAVRGEAGFIAWPNAPAALK